MALLLQITATEQSAKDTPPEWHGRDCDKMETRVTPISGIPLRQPDAADTRQNIQRHDPDARRKRQGHHDQSTDQAAPNDGTTLSVDGLILFLSGVIENEQNQRLRRQAKAFESLIEKAANTPQAMSIQTMPSANTPETSRLQASRAAGAYASTANQNQRQHQPAQAAAHAGSQAELGDTSDIRMLFRLIQDLRDLKKIGVEALTIQVDATFLESLKASISTKMKEASTP